MQIFRTVEDMRNQVADWRRGELTVGLVPTMGALHAGHKALVAKAAAETDRVITTIFINPTQFGAGGDLEAYPRTEQADLALIANAGDMAVFMPDAAVMYPVGFSTRVEVDGLTSVLDGLARPGHFNGVTQIVAKLLNQAGADRAYFGEKDWQQLAVVRRMVQDLDIPTQIIGVETVRDGHGLALSSRNAYLSETEIAIARQFNVILRAGADRISKGANIVQVCAEAEQDILAIGFQAVDYVACRGANDLSETVQPLQGPYRVFGAAKLGAARLIDNHPVHL